MARRPKPLEELSPAYRRRIERGLALGLTRSQARGHPRSGEPSLTELKQSGYLERLRKPFAELSPSYRKRLLRGIRQGRTFEEARGHPKYRQWTRRSFGRDLKAAFQYAKALRRKRIWIYVKHIPPRGTTIPRRRRGGSATIIQATNISQLENSLKQLKKGSQAIWTTVVPNMTDDFFRSSYPDFPSFRLAVQTIAPFIEEVVVATKPI